MRGGQSNRVERLTRVSSTWHRGAASCETIRDFELAYKRHQSRNQRRFLKRVWEKTGRGGAQFETLAFRW